MKCLGHVVTPQKRAQILEGNFGKPQNWKTSRYLSNFKFLGVICDKVFLKKIFLKDLSQKNREGQKYLPCEIGLKPKRVGLSNELTIILRC